MRLVSQGATAGLVSEGAATAWRRISGEANVLKADNEKWKPYNSRNHQSEGENVLFVDRHVDWVRKPIVGVNYDNIYTRQESYQLVDCLLGNSPANAMGPYTQTDSIIVP